MESEEDNHQEEVEEEQVETGLAAPPPVGMLAELQKRQQQRQQEGPKKIDRPPKIAPPPSNNSGGGDLQNLLAARRAKMESQEAAPPPKPAERTVPAVAAKPAPARPIPAKSATVVSTNVPVVKEQPEGVKKPAAVVAPRPSATQEPATKKLVSTSSIKPASPIAVAKKIEAVSPAEKMEASPPLVARKKSEVLLSGRKLIDLNEGEAADWITQTTADGEPYYVNKRTGKTTWDKPFVLMQDGEQAELEGEWIWVQHEELAWIPAKVVSKLSDGGCEVTEQYEGSTNERRRVKPKEVGPKIHSAKHLTNLTSDLVQLDEVHEPGIIDLLRRRYARDKIYTSVGDILIAVNPFKPTGLFSTMIMYQYADRTKTPMDLPPHPYSVINGSLQDLIEFQRDQSLLISGESGAGKTQTVKECLHFVSEIAGSTDNVEDQILNSNPLLEAFGNAKTKRNDNSSRFGKFMEVHLSKESSYKIAGCTVVHYLLEKSRVVAQAEGERNFHVFYYVVSQCTDKERKELFIGDRPPESFRFLSQDGSPCADPDQHDDVVECSAMRKAFGDMAVSSDAMMDCFRTVASVLHLGDAEFEDYQSTGSKVSNPDCIDKAAKLLRVPSDMLEKVLTKHESQQRDGLLSRAFNPATAADARNALARHIYGRLFDYLIRMVNKAMAAEKVKNLDTRYIGMLDIFGFEIFDVNSFEQLCINFANEKLQQLFNRHTFTLEEKTYEEEGIAFDHITFHDSQPLLTFLGLGETRDSTIRDGVFQILDEQTVVGSGTDDKFLQAVGQRHKDKKTLFNDLCKIKTRFKVFHYAGPVEYETSGFVAKNADKLYENIVELMRSSSNNFIAKELFGSDLVGGSADDGGSSMKPKTQASLFMKQLQALEQRTGSTFPRYVRCIKPNGFKKPRLFDSNTSLQQLRFAGVFEAVSIRKHGFPFRHTHQHFFEYFRCLAPHDHGKWVAARKLVADGQSGKTAFTGLAKKLWEDIVATKVPEAKDCRFGKSMVLFRAKEHRSLEIARLSVLNKAAAQIQKVVKGRYVRRHVPELRVAKKLLEEAIKSRDEARLDKEIAASSVLFFKVKAQYDAEAVRNSVREEKRIKPKLQTLLKTDPDSDASYNAYRSAVEEMDSYIAKDSLAFANMEEAKMVRAVYALCKERRDMKAELRSIIDSVPVQVCSNSIAALEDSLKRAIDLGKRGASSGGEKFYQAEAEEAKENCTHLKKELELCKKAVDSSSKCHMKGDPKHKQPGDVDSAACRAGVGKMRQDSEAFRAHIPRSADSIEALVALETILDLRESALIALEKGEGAPADDPEWRRVESVLRDVRGLEINFDLFQIDANEVDLIANDLALRAAVDDVVTKLKEAIVAVDDEQLQVAIDQANVLNMFDHPDDEIRGTCYEANDLLPKVQDVRHRLSEALREVDEVLLREALCAQSSIGFGVQPGMLGYEQVEKVRQLYAWVVELTAEARLASQVMYLEPSQVICKGCDEIRLRLPILDPVRKMLAMPKREQLLCQRDSAVICKNYKRAVRLEIEAKAVELEAIEVERLSLHNFPGLKTPEDFSRRFGLHWKKYRDNMLTWYNPLFGKIHTSLTVIDGKDEEETKLLNKKAPYLFRNVFAVMGDKRAEDVGGMALELLTECLTTVQLRDEVYCQLMKQLTQNPNSESENRGWNLMAMCVASFPPSKELENYLESFFRRSGKDNCILKLHQTLLGGQLSYPPTMDTVVSLRNMASMGDTSFWMPGERTKLPFEEHHFSNVEKIEQIVLDWRSVRYVSGMEFAERKLSKKRNSGGFEIHIGGDAPKIGAGGLSRMPSFMLSSTSHLTSQPSTGGLSAPPNKPSSTKSFNAPPPKPGGPPMRPGPKPVQQQQQYDEEEGDAPPPPPKPISTAKPAAVPPLKPTGLAPPPPKHIAPPSKPVPTSPPSPIRPATTTGPPSPPPKPIGSAPAPPPKPAGLAPPGTRSAPPRPPPKPSPPKTLNESDSDVL